MRDLELIATTCMYKLERLGVPYREVSSWKVNTRAKKRWGQCKRLPNGTFEININWDLLQEENSIKGLEETILHELLHTIEGCMNHSPKWNYWVKKVNESYGYNIKRTNSADDKGCVNHRESTVRYKYQVTCKKCNSIYKYKRMCWTIECCTKGDAWCKCGNRDFIITNL